MISGVVQPKYCQRGFGHRMGACSDDLHRPKSRRPVQPKAIMQRKERRLAEREIRELANTIALVAPRSAPATNQPAPRHPSPSAATSPALRVPHHTGGEGAECAASPPARLGVGG